MKLFEEIQTTILNSIPELSGQEFDFQPSPENQQGDFGLACFRFAKKLKSSPAKVAERLVTLEYPDNIVSVASAGPYVNFSLERHTFSTGLIQEILEKKEKFGSSESGAGKKVILEHTSINPNASPHIGRARNGLIGDTLNRLLRFEGYDVDVHYYVNDMGKQIGLLMLQAEGKENLEFHEVLDLYVAANKRAENDPEFEKLGLEKLAAMENGDPEVIASFGRIVDICLDGQLEVFARLGMKFDTFDRESSFINDPRMKEVLDMLERRGSLFVDDQGRKVADLEPLGYPREEGRYVVLVRANGSSMYMYRDIAYTIEKISRGDGMNMIVLGEDHKMYFEQIETIIRAMEETPPEAVHYSYILLKKGKMSTRKGTVVLLEDFLDETIRLAGERVKEQDHDLSEDERGDIARKVGIGAVRFAILSVRPNRNVIFDWDTALSFTGDTGPYIQYSCTRIASILRKHGALPDMDREEITITHDAEWKLLLSIAAVGHDIEAALDARNPGIIASSALEIARKFSVFYTECPVLTAPDESIRISRIALCIATRQTLMNLLDLLGIEAPERM